MTRALAFTAGVALTAFAAATGLVALAILALADHDLEEPDQCDAHLENTAGYVGPRLRCQEFAGHTGDHRHDEGHIVTTWSLTDA